MNQDMSPPSSNSLEDTYEFSNDWFGYTAGVWDKILPKFDPFKILEVGSYEGRSACYMLEKLTQKHGIELYCVDTWQGGDEHDKSSMHEVEKRFDRNIKIAINKAEHQSSVIKLRGLSQAILPHLMADGNTGTFDFIYIDGSHQAPDVLADSVMAFYLLKVGGLLIFDDYLWYMEKPGEQDMLNMPKPAIDAFLNIFQRKLQILMKMPLYQIYAQKMAL
jgi:predicted O-methyltransferase YrrM